MSKQNQNNIIFGKNALDLFQDCKLNKYALPAANVISSSNINACLEISGKLNSPMVIQFSNSGAAFLAGKSIDNINQIASIHGAICGAKHIHQMARLYNAKVMIHTDHCQKSMLPWIDGLLDAGQKFYQQNGFPLFGSHMIDLSTLSVKENIDICKAYLEKMTELEMILEIELGITGGEEDGIDNTDQDESKLYTTPSDVFYAYSELSKISPNFTIAASFGNVHGVYKPGNVKLKPQILRNCQEFVQTQLAIQANPINLVFHGSSGSTTAEIKESLEYGIVKMNIDTDLQWAYWQGVKDFYEENSRFLQGQISNPNGPDLPNKKYYDPRVWLRKCEESFGNRLQKSFGELNNINRNLQ
jgi:fructose-bisphosphate aldolase, class II